MVGIVVTLWAWCGPWVAWVWAWCWWAVAWAWHAFANVAAVGWLVHSWLTRSNNAGT